MRQHPAEQGKATSSDQGNPLHHTRKMSARFAELVKHLRHDVEEVEEPQFKAMFETAAEVMSGLMIAFKHYEQKSEAAWQEGVRKSQ